MVVVDGAAAANAADAAAAAVDSAVRATAIKII